MAAETETVARIVATLEAAKQGETIVVAVLGEDLAVEHCLAPQPRRLIHLASSLLEQAADMLAGAQPAAHPLLEQVTDALAALPDRFGEAPR